MHALYQVERRAGHIVTQVVETEFIVRTECNIGVICITTGFGVRLVLVDTIHRQTVEHIKRPHPLGVTFRKVVVHGYHMYAIARQSIQEYRERSDQSLTLTGSHLGDFTLMQHDTADQLHIVVYHVPNNLVTTGHPVIGINSFVAFDMYKIMVYRQAPVKIICRNLDSFILAESTRRLFHHGENFGKRFVENIFYFFQYLFLDFIDFFPCRLAFIVIERFYMFFQFGDTFTVIGHRILNMLFHHIDTVTQLIVRQFFKFGRNSLYFLNVRLYFF